MAGPIDSSGSTPTLRLGALAASAIGTLLYGVYVGLVRWIDGIGDGIQSGIDGAAGFVDELVAKAFGGVDAMIAAAVAENVAYLSLLGPLAQVGAIVEAMVVVALVLWVLRTALGIVARAV